MDRGMVQEGKPQRDATQRASASVAIDRIVTSSPAAAAAGPPPPLPLAGPKAGPNSGPNAPNTGVNGAESEAGSEEQPRRSAKRRPAGPPRARIAANDDAPSIGGLIFALQQ